jgi:hypothetical protein
MEMREYTGSWPPSWQNISSGVAFTGKIGISNHENQLHVVGVSNGDLRYKKRVSGSWNSWTNLGHPSAGTFDGPVSVSYSGVRVVVAGIAQGKAYVRLSYSGSWGGWVHLPFTGSNLGGSIAIVTRPNGIYTIAAFRPSDSLVFINCSLNYGTWTGWISIGGMLNDSLGVDNSQATSCGSGSYPGVHVVGFSALHTLLRCWEPYCLQGAYEDLGAMFVGPVAISNKGGVVSIVNRTGNEMMNRYRTY